MATQEEVEILIEGQRINICKDLKYLGAVFHKIEVGVVREDHFRL